jgi:hypothetical protein
MWLPAERVGRYNCCLQAEIYVIDGTQASKPQISVAVRHCEMLVLGSRILVLGGNSVGGVARGVGRANF